MLFFCSYMCKCCTFQDVPTCGIMDIKGSSHHSYLTDLAGGWWMCRESKGLFWASIKKCLVHSRMVFLSAALEAEVLIKITRGKFMIVRKCRGRSCRKHCTNCVRLLNDATAVFSGFKFVLSIWCLNFPALALAPKSVTDPNKKADEAKPHKWSVQWIPSIMSLFFWGFFVHVTNEA